MKEEGGKILGVIGGMGSLATQLFYKMVIERTDAHLDQEHINMLILNHATMPDRTKAILNGTGMAVYKKLLTDAKFLQESGATVIAIPCNTSHCWIEELQSEISIPIINMIEATAEVIAAGGQAKKVGILATDGTIQSALYQKACQRHGLIPIVLSEDNQKRVMHIIYEGVKNGEPIDLEEFKYVQAELFGKNCDCAIMGCTELSCFKKLYALSDYYLDAMEVLAEKAILACGKNLKIRG